MKNLLPLKAFTACKHLTSQAGNFKSSVPHALYCKKIAHESPKKGSPFFFLSQREQLGQIDHHVSMGSPVLTAQVFLHVFLMWFDGPQQNRAEHERFQTAGFGSFAKFRSKFLGK